ncbi:MAG: ABC transporter permease [Acidobacteria bacterium]|nr:ABC transporter permease [Acidobacteriota bacterium]MBV9477695.1 ABC transporter permease [Acidobacteriota bacterium]
MKPTAKDRAIAAAIAVVLFAAWELAARNEWISSTIFPPPTRILAGFPRLWREDLLENVSLTLMRFLGGAMLGGIPGIVFGLIVGWSPRMRRIADPFLAALHPIPKIVLFPLFIVIFGVSEWSTLAAIALTVFFPTLINAAAGARDISPLYFEVVRSYGGSRMALFRHVLLPGSLPMILSGVRIAANIGLLVTIAIEFTVTTRGIGSIIWLAWQTMRIENLYVGVIVCSLIGITINATIQWLLQRVAPWQMRE